MHRSKRHNEHRRSLPAVRFLVLAILLAFAAASVPVAAQDPGAWQSQLYATGLEIPVDLVFAPDGTMYYAELDKGNIRKVAAGGGSPDPTPVAHVDSFRDENGGFLGLALDPEFERTGAFFVYYSMQKAGGVINRVSRIDASGEKVLLDDIPHFERHNGGRLVFIAQDELVVVTGDNEKRAPAQDPTSLLGKTLRMTREGKPIADNINGTLVYSIGHRNPFGLAWDAENKVLWQTENGPAADDEVNIIVKGGNYGWPERQGITGSRQFIDAVHDYDKTIGPTGGTVLDGDFYFGAVNDGKVRRIHCEGSARPCASTEVWDTSTVLDVEEYDGRLYVSTFKDVFVVTPPGVAPPTSAPPATPPTATVTPPATVTTGAPTPPTPTESTGGAAQTGADVPAPGAALILLAALAIGLTLRRRV